MFYNSEQLENIKEDPIPSCSKANINGQTDRNNAEIGGVNEISGFPVNKLCSPVTQNNVSSIVKEERNGCLRRNADTMVRIIILSRVNLQHTLIFIFVDKEVCQKLKRMRVEDVSWIKEMIWSETDAAGHKINLLFESKCGIAAVVNTLVSLVI